MPMSRATNEAAGGAEPPSETRNADEAEALFHMDDTSFGVYPFPLHATTVENLPTDWQTPETTAGSYGFGSLQGSTFEPKRDFVPKQHLRSNPWLASDVLAWLRLAPSAAPLVFVQALPGFWLGRYRLTTAHRSALLEKKSFDLSQTLKIRAPLRALLAAHSSSIANKLWALEYHQGRFNEHIGVAREAGGDALFELVAAGAEFRAYAETVYSLLEETTRAAAILQRIARGQSGQQSFHKLHSDAENAPPMLRTILEGATWHEKFRLRRANAAHAFAPMLGREGDELSLYQHPDALIYAGARFAPPKADNAVAAFDELSQPFRRFYADYSAYLLTLFHPWDVVIIPHSSLDGGVPDSRPVWTRRVGFEPSHERPNSYWALMNSASKVAFRTIPGGGLNRNPTTEDEGTS